MVKLQKIFFWLIYIYVYIYCILLFSAKLNMPSNMEVTCLSVVVVAASYLFFYANGKIAVFGLSSVHLIYTIFSAFALGWVYFLLGSQFVNVNEYTMRFIEYEEYPYAVVLSIIAIMTYVIAVKAGGSSANEHDNRAWGYKTGKETFFYWAGCVMVSLMPLYLVYMMVVGKVDLLKNYGSFIAAVSDSSLYPWIILLYGAGICYIISNMEKGRWKIGIVLYVFGALILFLTGNKGEVLYALLVCFGIYQYKNRKFSWKWMLLIGLILFVIIPFVSSTRTESVLSGISDIGISFTDSFVEIGMQIRCTVYVLEEFNDGLRDFIWGFSYYNPIVNIVDNLILVKDISLQAPASFNFKEVYSHKGFNQIAEGYANFGVYGAMLYYGITGYLFSRIEAKRLSNQKLAYFGSVMVVFINVTRNKFAFVFGQILVLSVIYFAIDFICANFGKKYMEEECIEVNSN